MITSLSKLTMRQYIELVCGDMSVLKGGAEVIPPAKLGETRKRLIYEYSRLSDNAGSKVFLNDHVLRVRAKAELTMFQCLNNALLLGAFDEVRGVLKEYGITRKMDDDNQLANEVKLTAQTGQEPISNGARKIPIRLMKSNPHRKRYALIFDRQAASLMSYFKFQIDLDRISASQFACLVDQAHRQINAQMAALSKKAIT